GRVSPAALVGHEQRAAHRVDTLASSAGALRHSCGRLTRHEVADAFGIDQIALAFVFSQRTVEGRVPASNSACPRLDVCMSREHAAAQLEEIGGLDERYGLADEL